MSEQRDPIEYLLNAMEQAAREDEPHKHDYAGKRKAVLSAIAELRAQVAEAVAAERERCARICDGLMDRGVNVPFRELCAAAILRQEPAPDEGAG